MTNEQLVIRIKAGENVGENMEQLYSQVSRFIHSIAWKYRDSGEMEDLEQEGYLALYPAIDGYDPSQGVKFLTYAKYHIKQRMHRYLQMNGKCLRLPVGCLEKVNKYSRFCSDFQLEIGREPSDNECAYFMGLTLEQVQSIKKNACMVNVASLDAPVVGLDGGEDTTIGELVAAAGDQEEEIIDRLRDEQLHTVLWECVDELPERQADVIRKRYQEGMTVAAVGKDLEITQEEARKFLRKGLKGLRANSGKLRSFLPEDERTYNTAWMCTGVEQFNRTWTSSTERAVLAKMDQQKCVATSQQRKDGM